jgi:hypothetical protein
MHFAPEYETNPVILAALPAQNSGERVILTGGIKTVYLGLKTKTMFLQRKPSHLRKWLVSFGNCVIYREAFGSARLPDFSGTLCGKFTL